MNIVRARASSAQGGFSLIEMLVVLAVVGLVGGMAFPFLHRSAQSNAERTARNVHELAQLTRLSALAAGMPKALLINTEARTIRAESGEGTVRLPAGISFSATVGRDSKTTVREGRIIFYPDGSATGGSIEFTDEEGEKTLLTVEWLTGMARLQKALTHE